MRTETTIKTETMYEIIYDESGTDIIEVRYVGDKEITITDLYADEGKVLIEKATGKVLSEHITLGTEDSVENYAEVSA